MLVAEEGVSSLFSKVASDATNSEVHFRQFVRCVCVLLSIDRDSTAIALVCLDELQALHKHTTRTTARVVDLSTIRLYELSHQLNNSFWV